MQNIVLISNLLELIFPPICLCCGKKLLPLELLLCTSCRLETPYTYDWIQKDNKLRELLSVQYDVEWAAAFFKYDKDDNYSKIIHAIKFGNQKSVGFKMGYWFGSVLKESGFDFSHIDYVIAVPLHLRRLLWRGYNQSYQIAKGFASVLGLEVRDDIISRTRYNPPQAQTKSKSERFNNVEGIFKIRKPKMLDYCNVLLVDDVCTTGATLHELIKEIGQNSIECNISVITLSRTSKGL